MIRCLLAALLAFSFCSLSAQEQENNPFQADSTREMPAEQSTGVTRYIVDDIAAVVGGEIILSNEIKTEIYRIAQQNRISLRDSAAMQQIFEQVMNGAVAEKVLLHQAKEAKVEISEEELNQVVENQLNEMRGQFGSEAEFQRNLAESGMTLVGLKEIYREMQREKLMGQTFLRDRSHDIPRVKVTEEEARQLFDAQPQQAMRPEEIRIMQMMIAPKPGQEVLDSARTRIDSIYSMYKNGTDFGWLAEKFSDDPTAASRGGDLGYFSKGEMVKEFENAAFEMKVGEVRIVKSKFGWHLIRVEARRQKEVRARHVLARTEVREVDWERARELAENIRGRVLAGESFYTLAREFGEDAENLRENPPMVELSQLRQADRMALSGTMTALPDSAQRISEVVESRPDGYLLVLEMERRPAAPLAFEEIRDQLIERIQQQKMLEAYVDKMREKTYVDIRLKKWLPEEEF